MKKSGSLLSCAKFHRSPTFKDSSKCERLVELARSRITNLSSRTKSVISLSCEDIALLLQLGLQEKALVRVEQVYEDKNRLSAYAQIDDLCSALQVDFDIICKQRELPAEARVVVCTLIFAASRYGELPELNKMRNVFREWWGEELISTNVNLLPGNFVDSQIKEMLEVNPIPDDAKKLEIITEIAEKHNIKLGSSEHMFNKPKSEEQYKDEKPDVHSQKGNGTPDFSSCNLYKNEKMETESCEESSSRTSSVSSNRSQEEEIVYIDNNVRMRMKSPPPPYRIYNTAQKVKL